MKEKIMKIISNKIMFYCLAIFVLTFIFSYFIPYGGDDYINFIQGHGQGILNAIEIAKDFFMTWEGRFFSRIMLTLLVPNVLIYSLITATLMTLLFYFLVKIIDGQPKLFFLPLILMIILFIDPEAFSQAYVWKTGTITYLYPLVFGVFLLYIKRNVFEQEPINRWYYYFLVPLSFIMSMFVETASVFILMICFMLTIYIKYKYKKIDWLMLLCSLVTLIGTILMITSPGTQVRADENILKLGELLVLNIQNIVLYTFIKNAFLVSFIGIFFSYLINKKMTGKLKYLLMAYFIVIPLLTAFTITVNEFTWITIPKLHILIEPNRWYVSLFWIIYVVCFIFTALKISDKKAHPKLIFYILLAIMCNGSMIISPTWGGRMSIYTTFMLFVVILLVIKDNKIEILNKKVLQVITNLIIAAWILCFSIYVFLIYNYHLKREKYIEFQKNEKKDTIEVIILPSYYTWNLTPWGEGGIFIDTFKSARGISGDVNIKLVNLKDVKVKK